MLVDMLRKLLILLTISSVMIVSFSSCTTHGPRHGRAQYGHSKRMHKGKPGKHHGPKKHKKGKPRRSGVSENLMPRSR